MKKSFWLTVTAVLLMAAVIIVPLINSEHTPGENGQSSGIEEYPQKIVDKKDDKDDPKKEVEIVTQDETVVFFVQLDERPLIDAAIESGKKYPDAVSFMRSGEGSSSSDAVKKSQAVARASIKKLVSKADFSESRTYSAVFNAFTIKAPLSLKSKIEGISGVSSVSVLSDDAVFFETAAGEPDGHTDDERPLPRSDGAFDAQKLQSAWRSIIDSEGQEQFGGSGILIAVIDSEFNTGDPVFSQPPSEQKISRKILNDLLDNVRFNTGTDNVYRNSKIPFAYDYSKMAPATKAPSLSHGTSTAAVTAGNNGEQGENTYRGTAFDAQLALMKVAERKNSDGVIEVSTAAVLSALDDAVKLGADIVELGIGSYEFLENDDIFRSALEKMQKYGTTIVCPSGNGAYNGRDSGQTLYSGDIFYGTDNTLSKTDGVISAGSSDNTVEIKHFFTIDGQKIYYKGKSPASLYSVSYIPETVPDESSTETSSEISEISEISDITENSEISEVSEVSEISEESENTESSLNEESSETDVPEKDDEHNAYIYIDTYDTEDAFEGKDISGKLLILDLKDIPDHLSACAMALRKDVLAVALMNVPEGLRYEDDSIPEKVPFMILNDDLSAFFKEHPSGSFVPDLLGEVFEKETPAGISDFTSYFADESLKIGRRIIAPGQEIYSPSAFGEYYYLTGSSASSSCIAGVCAVTRQYLKSAGLFYRKSLEEKKELSDAVMLSHASPAVFGSQSGEDRLYYSPRLQGFGIADVGSIVSARSYLINGNGTAEAVSLGDGIERECEFEFSAVNFSGQTEEYELSCCVQTDTVSYDSSGNIINTLRPHSLNSKTEAVFFCEGKETNKIILEAGEEKIITVRLRFDEALLSDRMSIFPSGYYIDGYIFVRSAGGENMVMPFTGFHGSIEEVSPFDSTAYDIGEPVTKLKSGFVAVALKDDRYESCAISQSDDRLLFSKYSISGLYDDSGYGTAFILPDLYTLRSAYDLTVNIYDSKQKKIYSESFGKISSFRQKDSSPFEKLIRRSDGLRRFFAELPEGTYKYEVAVRAMTPQGKLSYVYIDPYWFEADNEKPKIRDAVTYVKNGRTFLELTASDKNGIKEFILYAAAYDRKNDSYNYIDPLNDIISAGYMRKEACVLLERYTKEDGSQTFLYDISRLRSELSRLAVNTDAWTNMASDKKIVYRAVDNALNSSAVKLAATFEYGSAEFVFTDQEGRPAKGIKVSSYGKSAVSDREGRAVLSDLEPDYYDVVFEYDHSVYKLLKDRLLIGISNNDLHCKREYSVELIGEYIEEEESSDVSSEISAASLPDNSEDGDDPMTAILFVGLILVVCTVLFFIGKDMRTRSE